MARRPDPEHVRCTNCESRTGLYDLARIVRDLGISEAAAEAMMRKLPKVVPPRDELKKTYVRGEDLEKLLETWTVAA